MARSLKLSALVSLVAYAGGAAALLWRPRTGRLSHLVPGRHPNKRASGRCRAARHHDDPDDSLVAERQTEGKVALVRNLSGLTPAGDLVRPGKDVTFDRLEIRLGLLHLELLVSARLLEYFPTRCDASNGAARGGRIHIGIQ